MIPFISMYSRAVQCNTLTAAAVILQIMVLSTAINAAAFHIQCAHPRSKVTRLTIHNTNMNTEHYVSAMQTASILFLM